MLKSERVASALSNQDDVDRAKVALVGYRDAKNTGTSRPNSSSMKKRGRQGNDACAPCGPDGGGGDGEPVISVDNRCLSCSGQAQHVLSGFKMACLQYAPGPVTFSSGSGAPKKLYKREELLDLRQRLLE